MSDNVLIVVTIAAAFVVVLYIFRDRLTGFRVKANPTSVEAELSAQEREGTSGAAATAEGRTPQSGVNVDENLMVGADQKLQVKKRSVLDRIGIRANRLFGWGQSINVEVGDSVQKAGLDGGDTDVREE